MKLKPFNESEAKAYIRKKYKDSNMKDLKAIRDHYSARKTGAKPAEWFVEELKELIKEKGEL